MPTNTQMSAVQISTFGGPEVLELTQCPIPTPGPGEVRVKVAAAGINRPDIIQRQGFYPPPPGSSPLPGLEISGTVDAVGADVEIALGTRVMALISGGGYAEFALAKADHVIELPDDLDFVTAAGIPETAYTVWANVVETGALTPEKTLFVHGATSGIGTMAAAIARAIGAPIFGTAGSADKCTYAEQIGYQRCFNYRDTDWSQEMKDLGGADIVLDMVGGDYVPQNIALMRDGGIHISIGVQGGMNAQVNLFDLMRRRISLTGSVLRARTDGEKARLTNEMKHHVVPWIADGSVRPEVTATFPLAKAADAHRLMESGTLMGKIVLTL